MSLEELRKQLQDKEKEVEKWRNLSRMNEREKKKVWGQLQEAGGQESDRLTSLEQALEQERTARAEFESKLHRVEVAETFGLSKAQSEWLKGNTLEELAESAKRIVEDFAVGKTTDEKPSGGRKKPVTSGLAGGAESRKDTGELTDDQAKKIADKVAARRRGY